MYELGKQRNFNEVDNCEFMLFGFRDHTDQHSKLYTVIFSLIMRGESLISHILSLETLLVILQLHVPGTEQRYALCIHT
jgi:hypothetical protein